MTPWSTHTSRRACSSPSPDKLLHLYAAQQITHLVRRLDHTLSGVLSKTRTLLGTAIRTLQWAAPVSRSRLSLCKHIPLAVPVATVLAGLLCLQRA